MSTYQYIHPSCNMKEESEFTHVFRSVDTNTFNPMVSNLQSNLVPLTFNHKAEITYPLGMCNNRLLQIGPVREDHKQEQFWNNYQLKQRYPRQNTTPSNTESNVYKNYTFNGVDKNKADVAGGVSKPIRAISGNINNSVI
jgi:hypothetical protein